MVVHVEWGESTKILTGVRSIFNELFKKQPIWQVKHEKNTNAKNVKSKQFETTNKGNTHKSKHNTMTSNKRTAITTTANNRTGMNMVI